jgi:hypothetical protein
MKKTKNKNFILVTNNPPADYIISIGEWEQAKEYFSKHNSRLVNETLNQNHWDGSKAVTFYDPKNLYRSKNDTPQIFVYFKLDRNNLPSYQAFASRVAHESVHVGCAISEMFGAYFNLEVQEPLAYLVQFLVYNILHNYNQMLKGTK